MISVSGIGRGWCGIVEVAVGIRYQPGCGDESAEEDDRGDENACCHSSIFAGVVEAVEESFGGALDIRRGDDYGGGDFTEGEECADEAGGDTRLDDGGVDGAEPIGEFDRTVKDCKVADVGRALDIQPSTDDHGEEAEAGEVAEDDDDGRFVDEGGCGGVVGNDECGAECCCGEE